GRQKTKPRDHARSLLYGRQMRGQLACDTRIWNLLLLLSDALLAPIAGELKRLGVPQVSDNQLIGTQTVGVASFSIKSPRGLGPELLFAWPEELKFDSSLTPLATVEARQGGSAGPVGKKIVAEAMKHRSELKEKLTNAIMMQFGEHITVDGDKRLHKVWSPFDAKQFLVVVLKRSEWEQFQSGSGLKIRAVVHKKGQPTSTLSDLRIYTFSLSEFSPTEHKPVKSPIPNDSDEIVWAVHNMTDYDLYSANTLD